MLNVRANQFDITCLLRPEPEISWIGPSSTLSDGRYSMDIRRTELTIDNVTASDEGDYSCTGSNTQGRNTHTIQLRVEGLTFQNIETWNMLLKFYRLCYS